MRQSGTEEKAALLLTAVDDEDDNGDNESVQSPKRVRHDNFPVVAKRPKTYQRHRTSSMHPVLCFLIIMGVFIFGCLSGVVIMLYRISQDGESFSWSGSIDLTKVDLSIKTKLAQAITKTNFPHLNHSIESENDSAKELEQIWQSYSKVFSRVNKLSYDLTLSTYAPSSQWSGIQLLDGKTDQELSKFNLLSTNDYLTFSSLVKSGRIDANYVFYVNYGRSEDFTYLIKKNQISFDQIKQSILFMRRRSTIISQTEQIRQAIRYGFNGLVLFDDNEPNPQKATTNDRQSFTNEWAKLTTDRERENFLNGISNDDDRSISVLILSYSDVQNIFTSVSTVSNNWLSCPSEWHNKTTSLKLGGSLQQSKLRLITFMQEVPTQLPIVLGHVRGKSDSDHFVMIGYQLGRKQQEKIINEIIEAYDNQMKNGWQPRRSVIFCAWSGLAYNHYTIHRWILDNSHLIEKYLVAYIDLGHSVIGNSTLNLHGSPLFQQIAQHAADFVVSPLVHDHSCHHRQKQSSSHVHRRHGGDHGHPMEMLQQSEEEQTECEPHKLFDEWIRAKNNRIGENRSLSIVQMVDIDSSAAVFQLQHGIPSILIEMTDEQAIDNDTFYLKKTAPTFNDNIQPEVLAAYTQFVSEVLRQLIDEPLIPFNLTDYANLISKQTAEYLVHYDRAYRLLISTLGDSSEMTKLVNDLTKAIQQVQSSIEETIKDKNEYTRRLHRFNEKLIQFERLFLTNEPISRTNPIEKTNRHIFLGPAFGLSNTVVPFPSLSNLLYDITDDPKSELRDASKLYWLKLKEHLQLMTRTLNGLDSLLSN